MPRPTKCRRVCAVPQTPEFVPANGDPSLPPIVLTVDEFETIRLIDREGYGQAECAEFMQIARTTVQKIYGTARKKLADAIVEGRTLRIEGGDILICDGASPCRCDTCLKKRLRSEISKKGDFIVRIAVTYQNGEIFQHFGHTEQFKIYDVRDGVVASSRIVDTNGSGHGALADVLQALDTDILICGGIGAGAQAALAAAGIRLFGGVSGNTDDAVSAFLSDTLNFNPNVRCSHHDDNHAGANHTCGDHGCGSHCGGSCHSEN